MNFFKHFFKYAVYIALGLIAFFLIFKIFGLHKYIWLRLLNGIIVAYGLYFVIKKQKEILGADFDLFSGGLAAIYTGFVASTLFIIFMAIYMYHIDVGFPAEVMGTWIEDYNQGPAILLFVLLIEGFAASMIISFVLMQKFKPSWNLKKTL
ncbi:DUF4199 domain-containing protein [Joostella sp. CR20]|uniref:DUF4199 domain-containing protein n=1 Tax=Joostella sp. CR20 TaxID=2804312 RepID=UPI00313EB810